MKALFTYPSRSWVSREQVLADVRELLGAPHVPPALVDQALQLLEDRAHVMSSDGVRITDVCRADIERDQRDHRERLEKSLRVRFPAAIERSSLDSWFRTTCVEYFGLYGTQTVASVLRRPAAFVTPILLDDLVKRTASMHGLSDYVADLTAGFRGFIENPTVEERVEIWSSWQALFAAKLIASEIGADPIVVDELRDALVLIDTNTLSTATLEGSEHNAPLLRLTSAFSQLGLRLAVLRETVDEYEAFVRHHRDQVLTVWQRYPAASIKRVSDPFVRTGLQRGCADRAGWERFFDSIRTVPSALNGTKIDVLHADTIRRTADEGKNDAELCRQIADCFRNQRRREKSEQAVLHDAAIVAVVEHERAGGRRTWVLTADRTMCWLSAQRAGPRGTPTWIAVDTVLEVIAAEGATAGLAAEDLGGILAAILRGDLQPVLDTYTLEDLEWLLEIEARVADLDTDGISRVALEVSRARLSGLQRDNPELHLTVNRAFQRERMDLTAERDEAVAAVGAHRRDLQTVVHERDSLRIRVETIERVRSIRRARLRYVAQGFLIVLVGIVGVLGLWLIGVAAGDPVQSTVGGILAAAGFGAVPALSWRYSVGLLREVARAAQPNK